MKRVVLRRVGVRVNGRWLFRGLEMALEAGEIVILRGPNGVGKTTLLRVIAGLREADEGEVLLDGRPVRGWPPEERAKKVGWLPQEESAEGGLRVWEVVALGRYARTRGRIRRAEVWHYLEALGLDGLADRPLSRLSGGERRRTAIARLWAQDPEVWLLDEPEAHLDAAGVGRLWELLEEACRRGRSVILATHREERWRAREYRWDGTGFRHWGSAC